LNVCPRNIIPGTKIQAYFASLSVKIKKLNPCVIVSWLLFFVTCLWGK